MKNTHIFALVVVGVLIAFIISASSSYSSYENFATAYSKSGKEFQVIGQLSQDKPIVYDAEVDANHYSFYMTDENGEERKVICEGNKPTDFERSEQIVLTGKMEGEEFYASKVLLKCPSKYIEDELNEDGYYETSSVN